MYFDAFPIMFCDYLSIIYKLITSLPVIRAVTLMPPADKNPKLVDFPKSRYPFSTDHLY